jgi:ubiquinone/menaquinone biosynthesis C-methylase UbiE
MKNKYLKEMYPDDSKNSYPYKLCHYLKENYLLEYENKKINFLDVCCGKGTHLENFSKILEGDFYGVDLDCIDLDSFVTKRKRKITF